MSGAESILVACPKPTVGAHAEMVLEAVGPLQQRRLSENWDGGRAVLVEVSGIELRCVETQTIGMFSFREPGPETAVIPVPEPNAILLLLAGVAWLVALGVLGGRAGPRRRRRR